MKNKYYKNFLFQPQPDTNYIPRIHLSGISYYPPDEVWDITHKILKNLTRYDSVTNLRINVHYALHDIKNDSPDKYNKILSENLYEWMLNEYAICTLKEIASGKYHLMRGVLSHEGKILKQLYLDCIKDKLLSNYIDLDNYKLKVEELEIIIRSTKKNRSY